MLYNKANTRTPLLNAIGGRARVTNSVKFVLGQTYASAEGDIPNISETASLTAPDASYITRAQAYNVTQIFMDAVAISYAKMSNMGTLAGVNIAGQEANPQNELDFQIANKMTKLARSIEKTFIMGEYNEAATDAQVNKTRGLNQAITTNVISATTGEGASAVAAPLDIWLVNDLLTMMRDNQADISDITLWVNTVNLNQLNGSAVEYGYKMSDVKDTEFGVQVRELILPIGRVNVVLGEFIPAGTVFALNLNAICPVEQPTPGKGNFFLEPLAKTGAGEKYQLFGQIGLDYSAEHLHGKITGLKTTFDKPQGIKVVNVETV